MAKTGQNGWYCATCRKMRSPQAFFCDICGQSWEVCMGQPGAHRTQQSSTYGQTAGWQGQHPQSRTKSPRAKNRPRSRKKRPDQYWSMPDQQPHGRADQGSNSWTSSGQWMNPAQQPDIKGLGKGFQHLPMQMASPPPPPPPLLMATQAQHGVPWMPQAAQGVPPMPFMPPPLDSQPMMIPPQPPGMPPMVLPKQENSAQQKLLRIVKASKKEDHLSPEFQELIHAEMKKDDKESTNDLLAAVKEHGRAKESLLEVESARRQLWSSWRVFLQQSVIKWREYTAQFQASEMAFQTQMQDATANLRRTQRRVDIAKKRAVALGTDESIVVPSEDEMDETEAKEEEEMPRDENAQKISKD